MDAVSTPNLESFARCLTGLAKPQMKKRVLALAKSLPAAARTLQSEPARGFADHPMVEKIITLIEQRCALTIRRLQGSIGETGSTMPVS